MPYDAPGKRVKVTYGGGADGKTAIRSGSFAVVDNKVLLLTKTEQIDRFVRPESEEATHIFPGELCEGFLGGVHEALVEGALANVHQGDKLWIDSLTNAILTAAGGGEGGANEVQTVKIEATGGTGIWTVLGEKTGKIKAAATAKEVQEAIEALKAVNPGDVAVTGGPGDATGTTPYKITFQGRFADTDVAAITVDTTELTGEKKATITTSTAGAGSADTSFALGVVDEVDVTRTPAVARINTNALHAFITG